MSVFISWRGSDREIKNQMVSYLKDALGPDEVVWESDEGCKSRSFEEFMKQIRKSEVFIVIVSDEAMKPSYVINEVIEARACEMNGSLNMLVYKITDSPYTAEFAAQLNHLTDVNHVARLQKQDNGFETLANRVKELLVKRRKGEPENPYETFVPEIVGTPLSSKYFVPNSRDDVFEQFDEAFTKSNIVFALQINGYGRRSAVREYALENSDVYKNVVVLHFFSGSLREFFIDGIRFSNLDESIFDNFSENDVVLRKARFMSKINRDTLVIVPDLVIDNKDDEFILDALSQIGCRVMFVSQTVPRAISDAFPVVPVGRMEDEYLKTLFFNYYDASSKEQRELSDVLTNFFDFIDGHTKSVEITASVLSDEIGVYPEDIPEILENISANGNNELSERIFHFISELFDISAFSEDEKSILLIASYFARQPIGEKTFVEMLKNAGVFDAKKLRLLADKHWLDNNKTLRTISIEPILAEVFISKIPENHQLLSKCIDVLNDDLTLEAFNSNKKFITQIVSRFKTYFKLTNQKDLLELFEYAFYMYEEAQGEAFKESDARMSIDKLNLLKERAEQKIKEFGYSELENTLGVTVQSAYELASFYVGCLNITTDDYKNDWRNDIINMIFKNEDLFLLLIEDEEDDIDEDVRNAAYDFFHSAYSFSSGEVIEKYIVLCETIFEQNSKEGLEDFIPILYLIGRNLVVATKDSAYICLKLCRVLYQMAEKFGLHSASIGFEIADWYFTTLYSMGIYTDEFDYVYSFLIEMIEEAGISYFKSLEEMNEYMACAMEAYIDICIKRGDLKTTFTTYRALCDLFPVTFPIQQKCVATAKDIIDKLIANDMIDDVILFYDKFAPQNMSLQNDCDDETLLIETKCVLEEIELTRAAIENPGTVKTFSDESDNYMDYYTTYADSKSDNRFLKKYMEIASSAAEMDYSSYSDERLRACAVELKKRASRGEKWQNLAPEAFALVSEAGFRILGYRHHLVQYMGGAAIADGHIAEIQNGEGKTYTIILAAFLHYLYGKRVHIMDLSAFLTNRNYNWMGGVLEFLGCRVGLLSNDLKSYSQDFDIIYAQFYSMMRLSMDCDFSPTKHELIKDVMIIDEADQVLVDEAVKSCVLTDKPQGDSNLKLLLAVEKVVSALTLKDENVLFAYYPETKYAVAKPELYDRVKDLVGMQYKEFGAEHVAFLKQAFSTAIETSLYLNKDEDYYIVDGVIKEEDKSGGFKECSPILGFFISRREKLPFPVEKLGDKTIVDIQTVIEFLKTYNQICGTTATAVSIRKELEEFYNLEVVSIPPNIKTRRKNHTSGTFIDENSKNTYIAELTKRKYETGQPVLIVTDSIPASERISFVLKQNNVPHKLLNAKNEADQTRILEKAGEFGAVTVSTAIVNRGVDIRLGGKPEILAKKHLIEQGVSPELLTDEKITGMYLSEEKNSLFEQYKSLLDFYRKFTEEARNKINDLGGLCVIGASCFNDLRIEQQMRGRCGRQGDNGESFVFFSLDDMSFRELYGKSIDTIRKIMERIDFGDGLPVESPILDKSIFKGRLKIQNQRLKNMLNFYDGYYRPAARNLFSDIIKELNRNSAYINKVVLEYFAKSSQNTEELLTYIKNKDKPNGRMAFLYPYVEPYATKVKKSNAHKVLMDVYSDFAKRYCISDERMSKAFQTLLWRAWEEYLKGMNTKKENVNHFFADKPKKAIKQLEQSSENLAVYLIENAVIETLESFLNSGSSDRVWVRIKKS